MRKKNIKIWVARLLVAMLTVLGLGQTMVHAEGNGENGGPLTDVVITKVETSDGIGEMDFDDLEFGIDDIGTHFTDGKPIKGVTFVYFNVSVAQLNAMKASPATYATADAVADFIGSTGIETAETAANGQVTIENLPEGNYWVVEDTEGTIATSTAVPFGLTLPFTNRTGTGFLEKVFVYPKNTLKEADPDIEKEVDESNVAIGQLNTWKISVEIPAGIEDYDRFEIYDTLDTRLDFVGFDSLKVEAAGITLVKDVDYTAELVGRKLEVKFTKPGRIKLANATSNPKKVVVTLETKVNSTAIMGQEIPNTATLVFDNGTGYVGEKVPGVIPEVHTGGKAFIKRDGATNAPLGEAKFKIRKLDGGFVKIGTGGAVTFGSEADATVFISESDGTFEVRGLPYGDYLLVEIEAPDGYALPTNPNISFVVDTSSYYSNPAAIGSWTNAPNVQQYVNNRKLVIPQTGGIGTVLFTVIGAIVMLISALFYRRAKEA